MLIQISYCLQINNTKIIHQTSTFSELFFYAPYAIFPLWPINRSLLLLQIFILLEM